MCIHDKNLTLEELDNYQGYDVVIRETISKEIDRQYSFMKWNIAVQTFLFASITQLKNDKYLWAIIAIGILASISSFATYWVSEAKIKRILYFWNGYRRYRGLSYFAFPPVWINPSEEAIPDAEIREIFGEYRLGWSRKLCLRFILHLFLFLYGFSFFILSILLKTMLPYLARYPTEFQRWSFLVTRYLDKFSLFAIVIKRCLNPSKRISLAACSPKLKINTCKIKTTHTLFD